MDVLHVIKSEHDRLRLLLTSPQSSQSRSASPKALQQPTSGQHDRQSALKEISREVKINLKLEEEYLYPEISGLFAGSGAVLETCMANHSSIRRALDDMTSPSHSQDGDEVLDELRLLLGKHFETEERVLMPKIRQLIPTQEREDLGQVLLDFKEEALAAVMLPVESKVALVSSSKRKKRA